MTNSRFASIIFFLAGFSSAALGFAHLMPQRYAQPFEAICMLIVAFNERIQGGKSTATTKDVVDNKDAKRISPLA